MEPDHHDIRQGLKLALVAVVSAVTVATAVISVGDAIMGADHAPKAPVPGLIAVSSVR